MKNKNYRRTSNTNPQPKKENLILLGFKIRSIDDLEKEIANLKSLAASKN